MSGERQRIPIPIDEKVISLARWAVDEYNKEQNANLEFEGVWTVNRQTLYGATNYWIVLDAADGGEINKYEAHVAELVTQDANKILVEFKRLLQA